MKIYTYYEDVGFNYQTELIEVWRKSWSKQGFIPVVLNRIDAQKSPLYEKYYGFIQRIHKKQIRIKENTNPNRSDMITLYILNLILTFFSIVHLKNHTGGWEDNDITGKMMLSMTSIIISVICTCVLAFIYLP